MRRFILTRIGMAAVTVVIVVLAVFFLIRLIPGDPAVLMLGDAADPQSLAVIRAQLGLNLPLASQLLVWVGHLLHGDLGRSISTHQAVLPLIWQRFQVSASIVVVAVVIAACLAVPAGMVAAHRQNKRPDFWIVAGATLLLSIPTFWLGLVLLIVFGLKLGWMPVVGYVSISTSFWHGLVYIVMPIATLALHETGVLVRMARASTLEVLRLDYVTHARAKGLDEGTVLKRHVFPNAFAPTWTLLGIVLGNMLGGVAVVETVFSIPGLGRLLVDSIFSRDYPVIQGCLLFIAIVYVVVNLIVDLSYPLFDPRARVS